MDKRVLVSFGRSDPLHLTEATHEMLGEGPTYIWGPDFNRPEPEWAWSFKAPLYIYIPAYDVVYCGHGATLLEATAAGCDVRVLTYGNVGEDGFVTRPLFKHAWYDTHLDHSGREVKWWEEGVMAAMARELRERRSKV